uniref:Uncharacterized protein n=1 Tax=Arundo donax TaxID=35708 RepID=A0A0A9HJJ0_ARUDO
MAALEPRLVGLSEHYVAAKIKIAN